MIYSSSSPVNRYFSFLWVGRNLALYEIRIRFLERFEPELVVEYGRDAGFEDAKHETVFRKIK